MRYTALKALTLMAPGLCAGVLSAPAGAKRSAATPAGNPAAVIRSTNGAIAVGNLHAQIDGQRRLLAQQPPTAARLAALADLLTMRGQFLGRIADYEEALATAEQAVRTFPQDGIAYLSRAKAQATFHRFVAAQADVRLAEAWGASRFRTDPVRAAIFQAVGRYDEASLIRRRLADAHPTIRNLQALAVLEGERGRVQSAAALFAAATAHYRDVSPFPIAWGEFQQGLMWMREGDLEQARRSFAAAHQRLPQYAAARGHLAEVEAELGNRATAIDLLRPLAASSDDPDYAAHLASILMDDGKTNEALRWRTVAAARFDALTTRYPEAFADHGTEFWLAAGQDPARGLRLAQLNVKNRPTPRAYELVLSAALALHDRDAACDAAQHVRVLGPVPPELSRLMAETAALCG